MAHHGGRPDPPGPEQPGQRVLDNEQRGLRELGPSQQLVGCGLVAGGRAEQAAHVVAQLRPQQLGALVDGGPEPLDLPVEPGAHPRVLSPLAREREHHVPHRARIRDRAGPPCGQLLAQLRAGPRHHHVPVPEVGSSHLQRVRDVRDGDLRVVGQMPGESFGSRVEAGGCPGGQRHEDGTGATAAPDG